MAKYRLTEKSLIAEDGNHGVVYDADTVIGDEPGCVPFRGEPGPHMEPLNDDAVAKVAAAVARYERQGLKWINPNGVMNTLPVVAEKPAAPDVGAALSKLTELVTTMAQMQISPIVVAEPRRPGRPPKATVHEEAEVTEAA